MSRADGQYPKDAEAPGDDPVGAAARDRPSRVSSKKKASRGPNGKRRRTDDNERTEPWKDMRPREVIGRSNRSSDWNRMRLPPGVPSPARATQQVDRHPSPQDGLTCSQTIVLRPRREVQRGRRRHQPDRGRGGKAPRQWTCGRAAVATRPCGAIERIVQSVASSSCGGGLTDLRRAGR